MSKQDPLGYCLVAPMRRDGKRDFAAVGGLELIRASVRQILGTRCASPSIGPAAAYQAAHGELPWNQDFGSLLTVLRHRQNNQALGELARFYVVDAIARWEPRVRVRDVVIASDDSILRLTVTYDVLRQPGAASSVVASGLQEAIAV